MSDELSVATGLRGILGTLVTFSFWGAQGASSVVLDLELSLFWGAGGIGSGWGLSIGGGVTIIGGGVTIIGGAGGWMTSTCTGCVIGFVVGAGSYIRGCSFCSGCCAIRSTGLLAILSKSPASYDAQHPIFYVSSLVMRSFLGYRFYLL